MIIIFVIIKKIEERMNLSLSSYGKELSTVRTGRANPKMLDGVRVEVYGQKMPISQLATVSIPEPQMINVQVWDKANVSAVDLAIRTSDLNLNPLVDGQLLRIAIPKLTEERRKELIKVLKTIAEKAKVAIRNIRRDSLEELKKEQKEKNLSEDELKKNSNEVQKITDLKIAEIDKKLSEKEVEILKVYTPDKKKYRTECIYAPKLYNYLIKCINNKEPFINPVTKAKYTQENIDDLMKVMKIIDPTLEVPVFIKHMNDTKLKLEYRVITETYNDLDSSFGDINIIRYYNVYLSRSIGYKEYEVYNICTIPADIEAGGIFATGSSDLTSEVMLFGIYRLFNEGRLLHKYIPPYRIEYIYEGTLEYSYIKTEIHFNQYYDSKMWIPLYETTKEDFINMFKHYAEEVKNYLY